MYKTQGNKGLFDEQFNTELLSNIGDPLKVISNVIGFEMVRDLLEDKMLNKDKKATPVQNLSMWC